MKRIKIPLLYLLSFVFSVGPVATYFILNRERYIGTVPEGIKLGAGAIILLVVVFLKIVGKLRMPGRIYLFGLVFIMCYLLKAVLADMLVFSFLALVGEMLDGICHMFIKRARERKTAEITAKEIEKVLNGRV